jgi:hypothetical protein
MRRLVLLAGLLLSCKEPEPPCRDTVKMVSVFRKTEASCPAGMKMTVENKVQGAMITCICPASGPEPQGGRR